MKERFGAADCRFIAVCVALLTVSTWFSTRNFYRAFPEASIDFRVNSSQGETLAAEFLAHQSYRTDGYHSASSFQFDDDAKTFLEREAGLEHANSLMGSRLHLWRWSYRWFRPLQKEEFRVDITPRGELAGFLHDLPEDAPRPETTAAQARAIAEDFLRSRLGRDPASLDFVESSDIARPHRTDRLFTWKEGDFELHDATYRLEVRMLGNEAGGYREYLKIPDQWSRDYQRLRSKNQVAQLADSAVLVLMLVGLLAVIVLRVRGHDIRWRQAAFIGVIAMVLSFASHWNQFSEFQYPTTDSYASFFTREMLSGLIAALGWGGLLFVLTAGAEPLYREAFPGQVALGNLFTMRGLRTKRFFLGAILGVTLAAIFTAYQTAFYLVAYRYGAWSPADVPYSDLLNTRFPWLFVLFGGFLPAVSEEFLFRMFGIPFLRKLARSTVIAVVLAGFIWGFGHAGYPQQPFYIRGVEVGIGGVALGFIMLRWGILPTLVWHYSVDAMYSAMLLVRSQSLYFRLSGAASAGIVVLPLMVALVAYWRRGGFEPAEGLLNAEDTESPVVEAAAEVSSEPAPKLDYQPLSTRVRLAAVAVFAIGLLALLIPAARFGDAPVFRIPADQARTSADAFLRARGLDPQAFRHITFPATHWEGEDALAGKYFLERLPVPAVSRLFEQYRPVHHWLTRYFKSLDQEEMTVSVHPGTGKILGFTHTVPEDRPGPDLPPDAARSLAAGLAGFQGWDVDSMQLKEDTEEKKKARGDHKLEWEAPPGDPRNLDEARYRVHIEVSGDRVTAARAYWKIPEVFERDRSRQNFVSILVAVLHFGGITAFMVWAILLVVQQIRRGLVPWRRVLRIAAPLCLLSAVGPLLSPSLLLQGYRTEIPLETFQAIMYLVIAMSLVFGFVILSAALAGLASFYPESLSTLSAAYRRWFAPDAFFALLAAAGMALVLRRLDALLLDRFHAEALFSVSSPDLIVSAAPAVAALAGAVRSLVPNAAMVAALVLLWEKLATRRAMILPLALLAVFALLPSDIHTAGEFALEYGLSLAAAACFAGFCLVFARGNYLAYALVLWVAALRGPLGELFGNPIPTLQIQAWLLAAVLGASLIWILKGVADPLVRAARPRAAASQG